MKKINLFPWREYQKEKYKKNILILALVLFLIFLGFLAVFFLFASRKPSSASFQNELELSDVEKSTVSFLESPKKASCHSLAFFQSYTLSEIRCVGTICSVSGCRAIIEPNSNFILTIDFHSVIAKGCWRVLDIKPGELRVDSQGVTEVLPCEKN